MEMPINVIIILFIALAVAGGVLVFASDIFTTSRQNIQNIVPRGEDEKVVDIEGGVITGKEIGFLADQCWNENEYKGTPTRELCFIIHGDRVDMVNVNAQIASTAKIDPNRLKIELDQTKALNSVTLYYDPEGYIHIK